MQKITINFFEGDLYLIKRAADLWKETLAEEKGCLNQQGGETKMGVTKKDVVEAIRGIIESPDVELINYDCTRSVEEFSNSVGWKQCRPGDTSCITIRLRHLKQTVKQVSDMEETTKSIGEINREEMVKLNEGIRYSVLGHIQRFTANTGIGVKGIELVFVETTTLDHATKGERSFLLTNCYVNTFV